MSATLTVLHAAIVMPLLLGCGILAALGVWSALDGLGRTAYGYATGAFTFAAAFWIDRLVPLGVPPLLLTLAGDVIGLPLLTRSWRRAKASTAEIARPPTNRFERVFFATAVAVSLLLVSDAILRRCGYPLCDGDEAQIWNATARSAWHHDGFGPGFVGEVHDNRAGFAALMSHADYPLLNPLLQLWVMRNVGLDHFRVRWPIQAMSLALVLALGSALRRRVRPAVAGLLILATVPVFMRNFGVATADSDALVALGLLGAADAWIGRGDDDRAGWSRLSVLMLALAAFAKHEGAMVVACVAAGALLWSGLPRTRGSWHRGAPIDRRWLALPVAVIAATWTFNLLHGLSNDLFAPHELAAPSLASRLSAILGERGLATVRLIISDVLLDPAGSAWIYLALGVLWCAVGRSGREGVVLLPASVVALALAGYFIAFASSPAPLDWHWSTAGMRVCTQPLGAAVVLLATCLARAAPNWLANRSAVVVTSGGAGSPPLPPAR